MGFLAIGLLVVLVGVVVGRWWLLTIPVALGIAYVAYVGLTGTSQEQDNPILFLVAFATVVMAVGIYARRRLVPLT